MPPATTVTFCSEEGQASQPIVVPRWSRVSWNDPRSTKEYSVFVDNPKMLLYYGPWKLNGALQHPPMLYSLAELGKTLQMRMPPPECEPEREVHGQQEEVLLPRGLFWTMMFTMYLLLGLWLWEVLQ